MEVNSRRIIALNSMLREKSNQYIKERLKKAGITDLSPSHGSVIGIVLRNGGEVQIKSIYANISKNKPSITEMINKLVKLGYLERYKLADDKRATYVRTTKKVDDIKDIFNEISEDLKERALLGFTPEEKETLAVLLAKAIDNF